MHKINNYRCDSGVKINTINLSDLQIHCRPAWLVALIAVCGTSVTLILTTGVTYYIYKNRYKIETWYIRRKVKRNSELSTQQFTYDAFVSYVAEDRFWVHSVLMKMLEDEFGFHVCIHYRDFPVGGWIFDAIEESITDSRATITVLSHSENRYL